jgi:hypothetical protein
VKEMHYNLVRASDQIHGQHSMRSISNFPIFAIDSSFLRLYPWANSSFCHCSTLSWNIGAREVALQLSAGTGSPARSSVAQSVPLPLQNKFHLHKIFRISSLISAALNPLCPVLSSPKLQLAPDPQCPSQTSSPSPMWTSRTRESSFE